MKKTNLDEMQEQSLLKMEHNGCWLAFWGLLAAILIQWLAGTSFRQTAGEVTVFLALSCYIVIGCLRLGIWDRRLKANGKTNFLASLLAGIAVGIITVARNEYIRNFSDLLLVFLISGIFTAILCFVIITACAELYKRRREKLDRE